MKTLICASLASVAMALAAMPAAHAAEYHQNAAGTCNGALPVFDQALRFRPKAVVNTASNTAFITCTQMNLFSNPTTTFGARIHNTTAATVSVACTFVSGRDAFATTSHPKTQSFTAGQNAFILWTAAADNAGTNFGDLSSLSCNLPGGVELEYIAIITTDPL